MELCSFNIILLRNENEQSTTTHNQVDKSCKGNVEGRETNTREYILCGSIYINFQNRQNKPILLEIKILAGFGRRVMTIKRHGGWGSGVLVIFFCLPKCGLCGWDQLVMIQLGHSLKCTLLQVYYTLRTSFLKVRQKKMSMETMSFFYLLKY